MSEIVSLSRARKIAARRESEAKAASNRMKFGRSKAQKASDSSATARLDKALDQARRDR